MTTLQSRREFTATLSLAGAAALIGSAPALADEGPPETTTVRLPELGVPTARQPIRRRRVAARRGLHRCPLCGGGRRSRQSEWIARGELDFDFNFPPAHIASIDADVPLTVLAGMHSGCLELFAHDGDPQHQDLKGKRVGVGIELDAASAHAGDPHGRLCRARSGPGHRLGHQSRCHPHGTLRRRQDRRLSCHCARAGKNCAPGRSATRSSIRPSTAHGRIISAACLRAARTMSASTRSRPSVSLRAILKAADFCAPNPHGLRNGWSISGFTPSTTSAPDFDRAPVRQLARVRPRRTRCGSTRCACTRRAHQVEPAADHRRRAPTGAS